MEDAAIEEMRQASLRLLTKASSESYVDIRRSKNPIDAISRISAEYDLLIIGTPEKDNWQNVLFGKNKDKFADSSACSVLRLTVKE